MKRIAFGLLCCFMLLTTGCTKNQDLQDLGMMSGISYDVAENGEFLYTCQIGRGDGVVTLEGKSDTMGSIGGEALRSTGVIAYRLNLNLVVISEEAARRGVQQIISALYTYEGSSGEEQIVIAKGSAKDLLATGNTETAEHNLLEMLTHFGSSSAFANCTLQQAVQDNASAANMAMIPVFEAVDGQAQPVGMAVLRDYRMVEILEEDEAKGALRVQGRQTGGRESVAINDQIDAGVKLTQNQTQVEINGNRIDMTLYCGFSTVDLNSGIPVSDIDKKIEEKLEEKVQKQVQAAFLKAQELDIDIMNLSKWFLAETGTAPESLRDYELNTQAVAEVIHGVSGGSVQ